MSTALHPGSTRHLAQWEPERLARASLTGVVDPGNLKLAKLVEDIGAVRVWESLLASGEESVWARRAQTFSLQRNIELAGRVDLRFLTPEDPDWPEGFGDLSEVEYRGLGGIPLGLWAVGPAEPRAVLDGSVAIVGSRASTSYGERVASDLGADLAAAGRTVVSGGAYGIDAAAHRGALSGTGATVAILAGGLDQWYPRGNHHLLDQVAERWLVLAEVAPGVLPRKIGFLARNRMLAAASIGTVLVEAAYRSGALNTIGWAQALVRPTMAVPGPVGSAASLGPHQQIADGKSTLVTCAQDVITHLGPIQPDLPAPPGPGRLLDGLDGHELAVREALPGRGGLDVTGLAERTGLRVPDVLAALGQLEQVSLARRRQDGSWALARPS